MATKIRYAVEKGNKRYFVFRVRGNNPDSVKRVSSESGFKTKSSAMKFARQLRKK